MSACSSSAFITQAAQRIIGGGVKAKNCMRSSSPACVRPRRAEQKTLMPAIDIVRRQALTGQLFLKRFAIRGAM